jgi:phospholipase D1/2
MAELIQAKRTAHQIVDSEGRPYQANVTSNVWVGGTNAFSEKTDNNNVEFFTTGRDYFLDLIQAFKSAQSEICITGWQVNWDALLAPNLRLYDLLREVVAASKTLRVFVMPWSHSLPVETYDEQTATVLRSIDPSRVKVLSSPSYAAINPRYFSHHQKQVVVDRKIAFVGGIDIAYGRYDDEKFDLKADSESRKGMNRYNGCVEPVGTMQPYELIDPDLFTGLVDRLDVPFVGSDSTAAQERKKLQQPNQWQVRYKSAGTTDTVLNAKDLASDEVDTSTLDPAVQPRMPWQDIHCRVEGPAVSDLLRNFVLRWNVIADRDDRLPMPQDPKSYLKAGNMQVQVLRSASSAHCAKERAATIPKPAVSIGTGTQDNIHQAMLTLIEKSRRFIYIENQFFVSDFGKEAPREQRLSSAARFIDTFFGSSQNDSAVTMGKVSKRSKVKPLSWTIDRTEVLRPPTNRVCAALIARIKRSIMDADSPAFHVYITLPVHSEGMLANATIAVQVYWTMQTLVFGSQSLLNGIRRALKARELRDQKVENYDRCFADGNDEYETVPIERCYDYVTLLNLRNWTQLGERYVTEQVYVHSKLMIVDDMYALIGSANVNDRSLLGERDSELAVLVVDGATTRADVNGTGSQREVRLFAHELRKSIWKKLFGIAGKVRPATELLTAINEPGKPDSWRLIQRRANKNAALYESAFPWVPRSKSPFAADPNKGASILPTWDEQADAPAGAKWGAKGKLDSPMPFQKEFWNAARHTSAASRLEEIKGFITALPTMWSLGENNRFEYPTDLVADNNGPAVTGPDGTSVAQTEASSSAVMVQAG